MSDNDSADIPFIYNLFPKLVGEVGKWFPHVERAADMGFNWVFLNPIQLTGASGSLYSIRDYFKFSPVFFPQDDPEEQKKAFKGFVDRCRDRGTEVMVDLVINHTAYDNPLTKQHRNWYKINDDGSIKNPGAVDDKAPGGYVVWGDLSEVDNAGSPDKENLHEYWWKVVELFLELGVRGFRCDAAYQVPAELWKKLIERAKDRAPETRFFAESLGCPIEQTVELAGVGHDFVFNSAKWWDYREDWFLDQLQVLAGDAQSVAFPESHDTERLAAEWNSDVARIKQHYLFTALISSGVLITIGFEYGFQKKPHVVHANPLDYEGANYDLTDFIREVNEIKRQQPLFQQDNHVERIDAGDADVLVLRKTSLDRKQSALLLFNGSGGEQEVRIGCILKELEAPTLEPLPIPGAPSVPASIRLQGWGSAVLDLSG
jgi:starch synthase (maltosyl-transferring)